MKRIVTVLFLLLFSIGMLRQSAGIGKAQATFVVIRPDGSIDPPTAPVLRIGSVYNFLENVYASIIVQISGITIDGQGYTLRGNRVLNSTGILLSDVSHVTVKRLCLTDFFCAIKLSSSKNCIITDNKIINNDFGVWVECSQENLVQENFFDNLWCGITLEYSQKNQISKNVLSRNENGIVLDWSSGNVLTENSLTDNGSGINLAWSRENLIEGNLVKGTVKNSWQGIRLHSSSNNTVMENIVEGTFYAVRLLYDTQRNIIARNTVTNNSFGVIAWYASNNTIYHNRFIANKEQAKCYYSTNMWDKGYPEGGNYWSSYAGVDEKSGKNQDHPGSDNIGDKPYFIDDRNVDHYPLISNSLKTSSMKPLNSVYILAIAALTIFIGAVSFILRKRRFKLEDQRL
ncbi:MAG: NosD domain-containing protein [Candidatus Bathyarchaeia archaeon]